MIEIGTLEGDGALPAYLAEPQGTPRGVRASLQYSFLRTSVQLRCRRANQ